MSKINVLTIKGKKSTSKVDLPKIFETPYRPDLIKRAVLSEQSKQRQPQGRSLLAGRLVTASSVGPGRGISKVPRTHGSRTHHGNRAAFIHSTVGGKLAFPPRVEKRIVEKINKKEYRLALWSAVSATAVKDTVEGRGHLFDEDVKFPIVIEDAFSSIDKTTEMINTISNLGISDDLSRSQIKKVRAGKGKRRGRKYRRKTGPLLVVSDDCEALKAGSNIPGIDIVKVKDMSIELLAPGTHAGRLTVWTEGAFAALGEWK
ncbi:MAG: 50S ribosomal protein L4 [Candidatus Heimdallarchaeota archaeon]|nr:50S ribosomal protein L4 [Candidatus Heimdallarchaeota archaeon]